MKKIMAILLIDAILMASLPSNNLLGQQSQKEAFMNKDYFDTTCSPCKDFYQFANGTWLKSVVIPPDQNAVNAADVVRQRNESIIHEILDSLAYAPQRHARNDDERKLGIAYCNCMDTTITAEVSLKYLEAELSKINDIHSLEDLATAIGRHQASGVSSYFWFVVVPDDFDPTTMIAEIRNFWSWRLPQQRNYINNDSASIKLREEYTNIIKTVFITLNEIPAQAEINAKRVLALETTLAKVQPNQGPPVNNKISISELQKLAPNFKWKQFIAAIDRPDITQINIRPPALLHLIDSLSENIDLETWKAYLRWSYIHTVGPSLQGNPFGDSSGKFFLRLQGLQQAPPRYRHCLYRINLGFANVLGRAYVERSFSPFAKQKATELGNSIINALRETLSNLEWLSTETRFKALVKLDSTKMQIGYPDHYPEEYLKGLQFEKGPFINTHQIISGFHSKNGLSQIGKPAIIPWFDAPTFPGAWYYATANTFSITASYLQPPFFDPNGIDIANYAAVGVTFGHEISHGFDNGGRLYNEFGLRNEWWKPEEAEEYKRRAELIVKQYNEYIIVDTIHQNGRSTLSENIADIGGLRLAYLAFKKTKTGQSKEIMDGFTPEQWFFIAFAQSTFRRATRPELLPTFANSTHSFHKFRVNGPLSNMPEFAKAFGCKQGDPMVRPITEIGQIWK